ncbi:MAG: hypothetical protein ACRD2L_22135, partial [Terriglobia bacterium]
MRNSSREQKATGPKPERLKLQGDWKGLVKKALTKKRPKKGWPKAETKKGALSAFLTSVPFMLRYTVPISLSTYFRRKKREEKGAEAPFSQAFDLTDKLLPPRQPVGH